MNFFKDPLDELDTDFSDISDVKPSDLDKILKSAQDLDDEILGGGKESSKDDKKNTKNERQSFDDPLADLGLSSPAKHSASQQRTSTLADKKAKKDAIASLFGLTEDAKVDDIITKSPTINVQEESKASRPKSSGDWLGLSESPNKRRSDISSAPSAQPSRFTQNQDRDNRNRPDGDQPPKKTPIEQQSAAASSVWKNDQTFTKKKSNLLDDLFGSERIKKDEPKTEIKFDLTGKSPNLSDKKPDSERADLSYTPSLSSGTRFERKRPDSSTALPSTRIGTYDRNERSINILEDRPPLQDSSKQYSASRKQSPNLQRKESTLPEWLGGTPARNVQPVRQSQQSKEWIEGSKDGESNNEGGLLKDEEELGETDKDTVKAVRSDNAKQVTTTTANNQENDGNVIGQLAQVQAQLGAAMTRHNRNLQAYMQILMNEAERVSIGKEMIVVTSVPTAAAADGSAEKKRPLEVDEELEKLKIQVEDKDQKIKEQSDIIFDLQTNVTKLELINVQLEMKIKNTEEIKDMEIEKLKKGYEFDISNWENRLERMKAYTEEMVAEYENKIAKLKRKEEETEKEFQKRVETLEAERLSDLEKLGEFHRLAMEQSTMISFSTANLPAGIRLPLKLPMKPGDEVELTEREAALIDKEKMIEIMKATIEAEKRELDEVKELEKVRREERERELKRALMEVKLKEEFNSKEYERKMEQLKLHEERLKEMREEALKEQNEISKEKLLIAAEKARLEAIISLQSDPNAPNLNPMDLMRARAEVDAALQAARDAREVADQERRRHVELRKAIEEISWEQKDKDQQLEMRERHISHMIKEAESKREEGLKALEEAYRYKEELEEKQKEIRDTLNNLETREKVLAKERLEIVKERLELEKHKSQLELLLPELTPAEDLTLNLTSRTSSNYRDPKAVIMRLKAEKDLQDYIAPLRQSKEKL
ncbi:hypothetical protein O3M35_011235 [Rhynocoris fuscipes]|uniref:Uncharacterized protein n=1 Tax=Rhynocoris fuscipes TaxID=488301 RepID=A0AAW1CUZ7_9HEMI